MTLEQEMEKLFGDIKEDIPEIEGIDDEAINAAQHVGDGWKDFVDEGGVKLPDVPAGEGVIDDDLFK